MTTHQSMRTQLGRRSNRQPEKPYMLVSRAADGRLRTERFESAAEYRFRLTASGSKMGPVPLDELIDLLDV